MILTKLLELPSLNLTLHNGNADMTFTTVRNVGQARHRAWLSETDLRLGEAPLTSHLFEPVPSAIGYALTPDDRNLPPNVLKKAVNSKRSALSPFRHTSI